MNKKMLVGILLFGSIWGMLECILGDYLRHANMPAGAILSGIVAVGLMSYTRVIFKYRGMQLGMGIIAALLRLTNPFTGCLICSAISIVAEGAIFEIIWYRIIDLRGFKKPLTIGSLGITTAYLCYVGGFITTQIMTPLVMASGFNVDDLIDFLPYIFARGLPASVLGLFTLLVVRYGKSFDISKLKSKIYYPVTAALTALCWIISLTFSTIL